MNPGLEAKLPMVRAAAVGILAVVVLVLAGLAALAGLRAALIHHDAKAFAAMKKEAPKEEAKKDEQEKWADLKKGGLLGNPPPGIPPPMLSAVIGDTAIINGQEVKAGAMVGDGMKVVGIQPGKVVLEKDGQKQELTVFNGI